MKSSIKVGAGIALVLLLSPVILVASRSPLVVMPTWLIISYVVARRLLPAGRQAIAASTAVICGQLAWRLLQALSVGLAVQASIAAVAVAVALAWLLFTGSRLAVWAVVATELAALALVIPGLPRVIATPADQGLVILIPAVVALYVAPVAAIGLLVPLLKREPRPHPAAEAFD